MCLLIRRKKLGTRSGEAKDESGSFIRDSLSLFLPGISWKSIPPSVLNGMKRNRIFGDPSEALLPILDTFFPSAVSLNCESNSILLSANIYSKEKYWSFLFSGSIEFPGDGSFSSDCMLNDDHSDGPIWFWLGGKNMCFEMHDQISGGKQSIKWSS